MLKTNILAGIIAGLGGIEPVAPDVLRLVSTGTKAPQDSRSATTSSRTGTYGRKCVWIADECTRIKLIWEYSTRSANYSETNPAGTTSLNFVDLQINNIDLSIPVLFDGERAVTLTAKAMFESDWIYAEDFGLDYFRVWDIAWVTWVSEATNVHLIGNHYTSAVISGEYCQHYNPASYTPTPGLLGPIPTTTTTGGLTVTSGWGPSCIIGEGRPTVAPYSQFIAGDSLPYGQGDSANNTTQSIKGQIGWAARSAFSPDGTEIVPTMVAARPGDRGEAFFLTGFSPFRQSYMNYVTDVVMAFGTNDCDPPGSTTAPSTGGTEFEQYRGISRYLRGNFIAGLVGGAGDGLGLDTTSTGGLYGLATSLKAARPHVKVIAVLPFTRISSTDSFATLANQSIQFPLNPEWWATPDTCNDDVLTSQLLHFKEIGILDDVITGESITKGDRGKYWKTVSEDGLESAATSDGVHLLWGASKKLSEEAWIKMHELH
jgi:hypothetical protein